MLTFQRKKTLEEKDKFSTVLQYIEIVIQHTATLCRYVYLSATFSVMVPIQYQYKKSSQYMVSNN